MVDQLRREAAIKRINVSQAIEDIKVSTIISRLGRTCDKLMALSSIQKNHILWAYFQPLCIDLVSLISLSFLCRSSYLIMRTRTTCWWDSPPKNPTHLGRSPHAVFFNLENLKTAKRGKIPGNNTPTFLAFKFCFSFKCFLILYK